MNILSLQNVTYQYEGTKKSVLKDIHTDFETGAKRERRMKSMNKMQLALMKRIFAALPPISRCSP